MFFGTARHAQRHQFTGTSVLGLDAAVNDGNTPFDSIYFFGPTSGDLATWNLYKPAWITHASSPGLETNIVNTNSGGNKILVTYFTVLAGTYTSTITGTISGENQDSIALYQLTGSTEPYGVSKIFESDQLPSAGSPPTNQTLNLNFTEEFTLGTTSTLFWGSPGNTATVIDIDVDWQLARS